MHLSRIACMQTCGRGDNETDNNVVINGHDVTTIDSAGAWILQQLRQQLEQQNKTVKFTNFSEEQMSLLDLIKTELTKVSQLEPAPKKPLWLEQIGKNVVLRYFSSLEFIAFLGEIFVGFWNNIRHPRQIQWRAFLNVIDELNLLQPRLQRRI